MHFVVSLMVIGAVVATWVAICLRLVARHEARPLEPAPRRRAERRRSRVARRPALPAGHQPPAGLGPLSPSERFLTQEAARGIRDLQLFLVDH